MTRRALRLGLVAGILVAALADASPASAHGIGGRIDLPVPISLFIWGATAVLVVSFVALGVLWTRPRFETPRPGRPLPDSIQRILTSRTLEWLVRAGALGLFLVVAAAAAAGEDTTSGNLAPLFIYVWVWVGLAFAHALFGNLWATISPFDSLARLLSIGDRPRRPYPKAWGKWPGALLLFGFVWLELAHPSGSSPRVLALAIAAYTVGTLSGMAVFGRDSWNQNGEAFAVYFGLFSLISPFGRDSEGRAVLRPPLSGLATVRPQPGLVPFLMVSIGSTSFDGFSASDMWLRATGTLGRGARALADTGGLVGMVLLVSLAYVLAMTAAAALVRQPRNWHPLAVRFVHSLVPIAFAYAAAHYFSLLVLEGQQGLRLLSDPFGEGWNLLGTAGYQLNLTLLSANAIWLVQVAAIVAGHVAGVVLAHDRSVAIFHADIAVRSQYVLLAIMVMFTIGGLLILSGA
ncbi:MAG: hypothetical protein ACRDH6_04495 [Actinomycetota bacterium]